MTMTREEAKEILTHNWTRVDNPNYSESELDEVFFMAIEALSAEEPTGELISRDDAIELLTKIVFDEPPYLDSETLCRKYAEEQINTLPSAEAAEGEWVLDTHNMELRCRNCGETFRFDDVDELLDYKEYAKFCLACGAKMTKGGDTE